jgi:hypothetical protein
MRISQLTNTVLSVNPFDSGQSSEVRNQSSHTQYCLYASTIVNVTFEHIKHFSIKQKYL